MSKRKEIEDIKSNVQSNFNTSRTTVYDDLFSLVSWCRAIGAHYEKEFKKKQALQIIPKRYYLYTQEFLDSRPSEADQLLLDLRGALVTFDKLGMVRSAHQRKFHESMIAGKSNKTPSIFLVLFSF